MKRVELRLSNLPQPPPGSKTLNCKTASLNSAPAGDSCSVLKRSFDMVGGDRGVAEVQHENLAERQPRLRLRNMALCGRLVV